MSGKKAVVLLSGGLDSATVLAIAQDRGFECHALTFNYGQRHRRELRSARRLARRAGVPLVVARIDLRVFGGSSLTDDIPVPKKRSPRKMAANIPPTYVPARNTIFLSFALARAETLPAADIFIGVNAIDYSGYPDCRPEYIRAFQRMANLATKAGVKGTLRTRIHTPLIEMSKADIVREAVARGVDLAATWSCYDPTAEGQVCGACDSCRLRARGFREAGVGDPLVRAGGKKKGRRSRVRGG